MEMRTALVVYNHAHAFDLQRQLDPKRERYMVIAAMQEVRGYNFDNVLVTDTFTRELYYETNAKAKRIREWLELDVRLRIRHKDGKIIYM